MLVKGRLTDSYHSNLEIDDFEYIVDKKIEDGGKNLGTSPHGLLAGSIAGCKLMVARGYMDFNKKAYDHLDIQVESTITGSKRHETVEMNVLLTVHGAEFEEKEKGYLLRIIEKGCTMANILTTGGKNIITTEIAFVE